MALRPLKAWTYVIFIRLIHNTQVLKLFVIQLLEEHIRVMKEEKQENSDGDEEDDNEDDWAAWEVATDSSDDSSASEGWISVSSDSENDLELSDSDDEKDDEKMEAKGDKEDVLMPDEPPAPQDPSQSIAATKVGMLAPSYGCDY